MALLAALLTTAIALAPALAHLLELPNKMKLDRDAYFTVQAIYRGWALLGLVLAAQLVALVALLRSVWPDPTARGLVMLALAGLIGAQVVFWMWTQPANVATVNWTLKPENWAKLRDEWEFSHAAGALFQLLAMVALSLLAATRRSIG